MNNENELKNSTSAGIALNKTFSADKKIYVVKRVDKDESKCVAFTLDLEGLIKLIEMMSVAKATFEISRIN